MANDDIEALLDSHDAVGLAKLVARGEVSARQLTDAAIDRIEARNPTLNAVVATRYDEARCEADGPPVGPLAGVPFLVKDLGCDVAGLPATRGSRLWADVVAAADSELARRFKAAGLVILGNTNTPELGKNASTEPLLFGPAHNPWRTTHSTGGSSGGSAAAVSAGIVPAAHANDGGGSIRIPASSCGLYGLKPTRGRTPTWPAPGIGAYPLGIGHAVTRTVRDSAAILDALAGPLTGDPYPSPAPPPEGSFRAAVDSAPGRVRIGFTTTAVNGTEAHPAAAAAVTRVAALLAELGHEVVEGSPAYDAAIASGVLSTIMGSVSAVAIEDRLADRGRPLADDDLEPLTRAIHERVLGQGAADLARAQIGLEQVTREVARFWDDSDDSHGTQGGHDVWLTPTIARPVPELGFLDTTDLEAMFSRAGRFADFTGIFNLTGQPAASVPAGLDGDGLPVGVQLVGRHESEAVLLRLSAQLEEAMPWPHLAPWPPPS